MPIVELFEGEETPDGSSSSLIDLLIAATLAGSLFAGLQSFPDLTVSASCSGSVEFNPEITTELAVTASCNGQIPPDPDLFGESVVDMAVTATLTGEATLVGFTDNDLVVTATCAGSTSDAERFGWNLLLDLVEDSASGKSTRKARLLVDGAEVEVKEVDWIEDEGSLDPVIEVLLAKASDGALITRSSDIEFQIGRLIAGIWVYKQMIVDGTVKRTTRDHARINNAPADTFQFTGRTPLQRLFSRSPSRNLVMYDPLQLTIEATDFDIIYDSNGAPYTTEIAARPRLSMAQVFDEIFVTRMGFVAWHSDLPDEFITVPRVDFKAGRPYIEVIRELVGFFSADFQHIGAELWVKDGTVERKATLPARTMTIRGAKLKNLAVDTEYEEYDAVELTYDERQLEYDFVTQRTETPPADTTEVYGWHTSTLTSTTYYELRRNSQPEKVIDEKIKRISSTVHVGQGAATTLIETRLDQRTYDLFGNLTRRTVDVDARIPNLTGTLGLYNVRTENYRYTYRGHPTALDKIFKYREEQTVSGLIVLDSANPMFNEPVRQDISTAYRGRNLQPGQSWYYGAIEQMVEKVTPLKNDRVRVHRKRIDHITPMVANDYEQEKAGSIELSTLINITKTKYVLERGVFVLYGNRFLELDAGPVPLRFAEPCARRHLARARNLPSRVSATAIDFDETIGKGEDVNFRGRGGVDLGVYRITSRRWSMRRMQWTASYTARQVGVDDQYVLVDAEDPHVPGNMVLRENQVVEVAADFECREGYSLTCDPVADVLVEARLEGDVTWLPLEGQFIDTTPYALSVKRFEFRFTTGTFTGPARREVNIYLVAS